MVFEIYEKTDELLENHVNIYENKGYIYIYYIYNCKGIYPILELFESVP